MLLRSLAGDRVGSGVLVPTKACECATPEEMRVAIARRLRDRPLSRCQCLSVVLLTECISSLRNGPTC